MIREGAADGPNFAGRMTFVDWGMAMGLRPWVIVDTASGRIVTGSQPGHYSFEGTRIPYYVVSVSDIQEPQYRIGSRLLILTGRLGEGREGVAYYLWTGRQLKLIRFYPREDLCRRRIASRRATSNEGRAK